MLGTEEKAGAVGQPVLGELGAAASPPGTELNTFCTNQQVGFTPHLWQPNLGEERKEGKELQPNR